MSDISLGNWLLVWCLASAVVVMRHWRHGFGVGLVFTYALSFGVIHALAPAMYLLPWYDSSGLDLTVLGLRESAVAMVAFMVGTEVWRLLGRGHAPDPDEESRAFRPVDNRIANLCLVLGVVTYGIASPILSQLPSGAAIASTGGTLGIAGIGFKCWNAWVQQRQVVMWAWLLSTMALPIVTVVGQGFLGFGFAAMLSVMTFVANFYRPRWLVAAVGMVLLYLGLSVYVTYMRDRTEIRDVVWAGAAITDRLDQLEYTAANAEWFNPSSGEHLRRIDERLNQDFLIGAAIVYLDAGMAQYAHGQTLWLAVAALVPRALWPDKPTVGGSGSIVSDYTGINFAEGTSVGVGHLLEAYINMGRAGVILFFGILGALLSWIDQRAARVLRDGDATRLILWYLPGLGMLNVGGAFSELTSTAAAAVVTAYGLRWVAHKFYPERRGADREAEATGTRLESPEALR